MKPSQISTEQVNKLKEMCESLFPKYRMYWDHEHQTLSNGDDEPIHWFEFILTHLAVELKRFGIHYDFWLMSLPSTHCQWGSGPNHPVDYIYKLFKERGL